MKSIRSRLIIGLIAMMLPLVILATGSLTIFERIGQAIDEIIIESSYEMMPVVRLQEVVNRSAMPANDYLLHGSTMERENYQQVYLQAELVFSSTLSNLRRYGNVSEYELLRAAQQRWRDGHRLSQILLELPIPLEDPLTAANQMEMMDRQFNEASELIGRVITMINEENHQNATDAHRELNDLTRLAGLLLLGGALFAVTIGYTIARSIALPLRKIHEGTQRFGAGELDFRIQTSGEDELSTLAVAFNRMAEQVEHLTLHDPLTGLLNRRNFTLRLQEEIQRAGRNKRPLTLLMMDADHFKRINDTHGHQIGDDVLRELAKRVTRSLREIDLLFRYGGEEFVALLPETDVEQARQVAERIRDQIAAHPLYIEGGPTIELTVSIGLAVCPFGKSKTQQLINAADQALYQAKADGRNRVVMASPPGDEILEGL